LPSNQYSIGIFNKEGRLKDTIPSFYPYTTPLADDIYQTTIDRLKTGIIFSLLIFSHLVFQEVLVSKVTP
jgi:hypothetical protein